MKQIPFISNRRKTPDFSALQELLALKRQEIPVDTEVNRFLIELHRRQRACLLQPVNPGIYALTWFQDKFAAFSESLSGFGSNEGARPLAWGASFAVFALVIAWSLNTGSTSAPALSAASAVAPATFSINSASLASAIPAKSLITSPAQSELSRFSESFKFNPRPLAATVPQFVSVDVHAAYDARPAF